MGSTEKEPMLELFMQESLELISELNGIIEDNREMERYEYDSIKDIFRIFHTLKADATMMLFENIAEPARSFERVLYYYRDQEKAISTVAAFNELLDEIVEFVQGELDKIEMSKKADGNCDYLIEKIENYYKSLNTKEITSETKKEKQVYYIAGKSDDATKGNDDDMVGSYVIDKKVAVSSENKESEGQDAEPLKARQETKYNRKKHTLITDEDVLALKAISYELDEVLDNYAVRFKNVSIIALEEDNLEELRAYSRRIKRWIKEVQATDFKGIALKMKSVVREMEATLSKPIELVITGEDTVIEKNSLEKISSAMVHILRNSVDHGIEEVEERIKAGKEKVGHIYIDITKQNQKVQIVMSDDGVGLNKEHILMKAKEKGLLTKAEEEYTEEEIYGFLLEHGFTTRDEVSNYSGLGVGLDVVNQNVKELGGEIRINSAFSRGTKFTIVV